MGRLRFLILIMLLILIVFRTSHIHGSWGGKMPRGRLGGNARCNPPGSWFILGVEINLATETHGDEAPIHVFGGLAHSVARLGLPDLPNRRLK